MNRKITQKGSSFAATTWFRRTDFSKHNINTQIFYVNTNCTYFCTKYIIMVIANISDFRKDIKSYFDKVAKNFETLIINRGKDSGIVVMSLDEYNSLMATNYELSSRMNEKRLDSAIEKLRAGKTFSKDLLEE